MTANLESEFRKEQVWVASLHPVLIVLSMGLLLVLAGLLQINLKGTPWALSIILIGAIVWTAFRVAPVSPADTVVLWRPMLAGWGENWIAGLREGTLTQLPLTLLNSVFAVSLLAGRLFPEANHRSRPTRIALSVGIINLITIPWGGMPVCHGSGGLAAQHGCGARSGRAVVLLGTVKLVIGLFFGTGVLVWLIAFPQTVLAFFLLHAGFCLTRASRVWRSLPSVMVGGVTNVVYFTTGLLPLGFAAGWLTQIGLGYIQKESSESLIRGTCS